MTKVSIRVEGLDKLRAALRKFPSVVAQDLAQAGNEAANLVLDTEGVRSYPPSTEANLAPPPYYVRGRGMQYANRNDGRSERYGTKFTVQNKGYGTVIGNTASYAQYLAGAKQAGHLAERAGASWRML